VLLLPSNILSGDVIQILMIVGIFAVFMFLIIIPQRRRNKKVKDMMAGIKPGDRIKTIGGFYGKVIQLKEDIIIFECGPDKVKLELSKGAVAAVQGADVENEMTDKEIAQK
jgi:preprotein translocase subunit YajC